MTKHAGRKLTHSRKRLQNKEQNDITNNFLDKNSRRVQQKINKTYDYIAFLIYPWRHLALDDYDLSE